MECEMRTQRIGKRTRRAADGRMIIREKTHAHYPFSNGLCLRKATATDIYLFPRANFVSLPIGREEGGNKGPTG